MTKATGFALTLLLSTSAFAASFDLRVTLDAPARSRPGDTLVWSGTVENHGPDPAENVYFSLRSAGFTPCAENVMIARLAAGERYTIPCQRPLDPVDTTPIFLGGEAFAARSSTDDRDRGNDRAFVQVYLVDTPDLSIDLLPVTPYVTPDLPFPITVLYGNRGFATATGVTVIFSSPDIQGFAKLPPFCRDEVTRAVCTIDALAPQLSSHPFVLEPIATGRSRSDVRLKATIDGNEDDPQGANDATSFGLLTYDTTFVTNTNDSGDSSLRDAIEKTNERCRDSWICKIAFRIDPQGAPWLTIKPGSPLPIVRGRYLEIDGSTQASFFGDTNPDGPEIEINGSRAGASDGLSLLLACTSLVRGLAINGFSGNGVYSTTTSGECGSTHWPAAGISASYIGTDPTGIKAVPNGRGVFLERFSFTPFGIGGSIISGNLHSGVFVWTAGSADIVQSRIGINRTLTAPLSNGASGIFVGEHAYATVTDSHVSFNGHFGVSIARGGRFFSTGNSFQANHQLAIDHGLDGPTPDVPLKPPVIVSARYDAATDITTIEGMVNPVTRATFDETSVNVYANDAPDAGGYGEGQYFLRRIVLPRDVAGFTLRHKGDLRGKWIAATTTHVAFLVFAAQEVSAQQFPIERFSSLGTSEFSRAVEVGQ